MKALPNTSGNTIKNAAPKANDIKGIKDDAKGLKRDNDVYRREMIAEGWEFERGTMTSVGAKATLEERNFVGRDCRRFFNGILYIVKAL